MSRYKVKVAHKEYNDEVTKKGHPVKVVWYVPIILRFKRLFANTDGGKP